MSNVFRLPIENLAYASSYNESNQVVDGDYVLSPPSSPVELTGTAAAILQGPITQPIPYRDSRNCGVVPRNEDCAEKEKTGTQPEKDSYVIYQLQLQIQNLQHQRDIDSHKLKKLISDRNCYNSHKEVIEASLRRAQSESENLSKTNQELKAKVESQEKELSKHRLNHNRVARDLLRMTERARVLEEGAKLKETQRSKSAKDREAMSESMSKARRDADELRLKYGEYRERNEAELSCLQEQLSTAVRGREIAEMKCAELVEELRRGGVDKSGLQRDLDATQKENVDLNQALEQLRIDFNAAVDEKKESQNRQNKIIAELQIAHKTALDTLLSYQDENDALRKTIQRKTVKF